MGREDELRQDVHGHHPLLVPDRRGRAHRAREDHAVAEAWGVWGEKSLYGKKFMGIVRPAFVVDDKGKLSGVFYKVSPKDTVPNAQAALAG